MATHGGVMDEERDLDAGYAGESDSSEDPNEDETREAERLKILDALGASMAKTRAEAIDGRANSGIETQWLEDEEHYEGIDDANRGELSTWASKPMGQAAPSAGKTVGSNVFFNITQPYVDAGAARVSDVLLPTDGKGWKIDPTPIADLLEIADGNIPKRIQDQIASEHEKLGTQDMIGQTVTDLVQQTREETEEAKDKAKKAELRIEDWHVECQYAAHVRQVIEDAGKIGTGVLKGPVPTLISRVAYIGGKLTIKEDLQPESRRIDAWNCFPDPSCGQNIHHGSYFWERDDITRKTLDRLRKDKNYLSDQIDKVLEEGPHEAYNRGSATGPKRQLLAGLSERKNKSLFEIWYFHGSIDRDDLEAAGVEIEEEFADRNVFPARLTMVNNRVIQADLNHLDTGEFPYDFFVWQRRTGMPFGLGLARQVRTPQRMVNGAARNMMDNAGIAGGPIVLIHSGKVTAAEGTDAEIAPWVVYYLNDDVDLQNADKAFQFITTPMYQKELEAIIMLGLKLAEDVTGLPMLLQGQQSQHQETLGTTQIRNNNASTVLRRIARLFDDMLTEPHIRRYYSYLLQYSDDAEKGDFTIDATGSSTLIQRDLASQGLAQLGSIVANPIYGKDPKKWINELLRSQQINPEMLDYDDDKWKEIVEGLSQGEQDPRLAVAQLRAQTEERLKQLDQAFETAEADKDRQIQVAFKTMDRELDGLIANSNDKGNADKIKALLTKTAMTLQAQFKMAGIKEVAAPLAEPPGRARDGHAFEE